MCSSRIVTTAAIAAVLVCSCSGPENIASGPSALPQTSAAHAVGQSSSGEPMTGTSPELRYRLEWRPDHLLLQKGVKQQAKLFYVGRLPLRIADDCTGRVALDQIGFARIKRYRINIYDVLALRSGPFRCSVLARVVGERAHALLRIEVSR
jgi:hypothetical protein